MKPILFNTAMVQAILDGRKTTTRRIVKGNINDLDLIGTGSSKCNDTFDTTLFGKLDKEKVWNSDVKERVKAPYMPGDVLYVRETWKQYEKRVGRGNQCHLEKFYGYKTDESNPKNPSEFYDGNWKPSIHMPKVAARIFLKVTCVRVERLKRIEAGQCKAEGIDLGYKIENSFDAGEYCKAFGELWDSTVNKKDIDKYSWNANPYVWVIEFERIEKSEVEQ